jgi:hypothetical protein
VVHTGSERDILYLRYHTKEDAQQYQTRTPLMGDAQGLIGSYPLMKRFAPPGCVFDERYVNE